MNAILNIVDLIFCCIFPIMQQINEVVLIDLVDYVLFIKLLIIY